MAEHTSDTLDTAAAAPTAAAEGTGSAEAAAAEAHAHAVAHMYALARADVHVYGGARAPREGDAAVEDEDARPGDPPIGSIAKHEWPELVGKSRDEAIAVIESERPDMLIVKGWAEGAIVSTDVAARRVRVWFDPATQLVTRPPKVG